MTTAPPDPRDRSRLGVSGSRSGSPAGRTLGPYLLHRELGRGANGVVYLAQRRPGDLLCALKVITAVDTESLLRFKLEAQATARIEHPGILRIYDTGQEGRYHYYAMEYCAGPTLRERLKAGPLPVKEAVELVADLAETVACAHDRGIIHRDLKPENVILDAETGRPRITDFGLARDRELTRNLTQTGAVLGTPAYMAPEQVRGERDLDHRVDVYSLGAILYECLSGRPPFMAAELVTLFLKVQRDPLPPLRTPGVPGTVEAICYRALAKQPADRHAHARDLAEELAGAQTEAVQPPAGQALLVGLAITAGVSVLVTALLLGAQSDGVAQAPVAAVPRSSSPAASPPETAPPSVYEPAEIEPSAVDPPEVEPPGIEPLPFPTRAVGTRRAQRPPADPVQTEPSVVDWGQLVQRGDRHFSSGDYEQAARHFKEATDRFPRQPIPHLALGHALFGQGDFGAAATSLRTGVSIYPAWPAEGRDLRQMFSPDVLTRRAQELQAQVEARPDDTQLLFLLGYVQHFCGHAAPARRVFSHLLELRPDDAEAGSFLAR